jgi:hypothetical protein
MAYVLYGQATFSNQTRRNQARTAIQNQMDSRGFTAFAWDGYQAGAVNVGNTGLRCCFRTESFANVELVESVINSALQSNQWEGDFGWQDLGG